MSPAAILFVELFLFIFLSRRATFLTPPFSNPWFRATLTRGGVILEMSIGWLAEPWHWQEVHGQEEEEEEGFFMAVMVLEGELLIAAIVGDEGLFRAGQEPALCLVANPDPTIKRIVAMEEITLLEIIRNLKLSFYFYKRASLCQDTS